MRLSSYLGHDVKADNTCRVAHLAHDAAGALCCHLNIVAPGQRTRHEIHVRGGLTSIASRAIRIPRHRPTVMQRTVVWATVRPCEKALGSLRASRICSWKGERIFKNLKRAERQLQNTMQRKRKCVPSYPSSLTHYASQQGCPLPATQIVQWCESSRM